MGAWTSLYGSWGTFGSLELFAYILSRANPGDLSINSGFFRLGPSQVTHPMQHVLVTDVFCGHLRHVLPMAAGGGAPPLIRNGWGWWRGLALNLLRWWWWLLAGQLGGVGWFLLLVTFCWWFLPVLWVHWSVTITLGLMSSNLIWEYQLYGDTRWTREIQKQFVTRWYH